MFLGYNTNGFAHHDLFDAIEILADLGYRGVGITIDHGSLSPREDCMPQLAQLQSRLASLGLRSAIETGARFLLHPRLKHEPTLVSADPQGRAARVEFYRYAIRCAAELGSDCVSIWSGAVRDGCSDDVAIDRLLAGLELVLDDAEQCGVAIAFEPEPGMFIDTMARFESLLARLAAPSLKLTIDVGHLHCQGETPIADQIRRWAPRLANVHLDDMTAGRHEHQMFGEGEIQFPPILRALAEIGYDKGVYVELSRHSHEAPDAARRAFQFLSPLM